MSTFAETCYHRRPVQSRIIASYMQDKFYVWYFVMPQVMAYQFSINIIARLACTNNGIFTAVVKNWLQIYKMTILFTACQFSLPHHARFCRQPLTEVPDGKTRVASLLCAKAIQISPVSVNTSEYTNTVNILKIAIAFTCLFISHYGMCQCGLPRDLPTRQRLATRLSPCLDRGPVRSLAPHRQRTLRYS